MSPITNDSSSILLAYKAISILVKGKHSYNPYTKLKYFYWGKDLLDFAKVLFVFVYLGGELGLLRKTKKFEDKEQPKKI